MGVGNLDLKKHMTNQYKSRAETEMKNMIEHARELQKNHVENGDNPDGISFLKVALEKGIIDLSKFTSILPIVEDYNKPYVLEFT